MKTTQQTTKTLSFRHAGSTAELPVLRPLNGKEIVVDIVVPVLNEAHVLGESIATLQHFSSPFDSMRLSVVRSIWS